MRRWLETRMPLFCARFFARLPWSGNIISELTDDFELLLQRALYPEQNFFLHRYFSVPQSDGPSPTVMAD